MEKSAKSIPHSLVNLKSSTWFREHTPSAFFVYLAFNKYVLDTPLYREMYRILGESMNLSRMSLTNWLEKGPLISAS